MITVISYTDVAGYFYIVNRKTANNKTFFMRHLFFFPILLSALAAGAQARYSGSAIDLTVSGTSTLHDWTMKSVKADCSA